VELSPELPNGYLDITPVFKINTALHNAGLKNFVVIISIIRDVYRENEAIIPQADLDRLELTTELRNISLKQVQALWESRLYPLHAQATPKPQSSIAPLELSALESEYPGGKANLRDCLIFGGKLYKKYKDDLINSGDGEPQPSEPTEEFKLLWQHEFKNNQEEISKVNQFSGIELVNMLKKALTALEIKIIKQKLLSSPTYAGSSFSYLCPKSKQEIGIFWNESPNMQSLAFAMKACHKTLGNALCDSLILIRQEGFASQKGKAYSDYIQIFHMGANQHIKVDTESLHYLRTYQLLVNEAYSGNLVIGSQVINPEKLEELVRKSEVLKSCCLLQDLKIFGKIPPPPRPDDIYIEWVKTFLKVYQFMSRATLEKNIKQQFPQIQDEEIDRIVSKLLCEPSPFITILDTSVSKDEQLVCLIPQTDHVLSH
jgi:hypothetical protein